MTLSMLVPDRGPTHSASAMTKLMFIADNLPTQTVDSFNATNDSIVVYGIHVTNGFDLG